MVSLMDHSAPAPVICRPRREVRKDMHAAASSSAKTALSNTALAVDGGSSEKKRGQDLWLKGGGGVGSDTGGALSAPARVSEAHTVEARSGDSSNAEALARNELMWPARSYLCLERMSAAHLRQS
jgi:hypothetical protein